MQLRTAIEGATALGLAEAARRYHRKRIQETVSETRREARRRLIERLRQDPRGVFILDTTFVSNSTIPGPITVLGDDVVITGCQFTNEEQSNADVQ